MPTKMVEKEKVVSLSQLEIGTKFEWDCDDGWNDDEDEPMLSEVTVGGYVYYGEELYYVCVTDEGIEIDAYAWGAEQAATRYATNASTTAG